MTRAPSFLLGVSDGLFFSSLASGATSKYHDPVKESNHPGYITFAKTGQRNCRATQVFINFFGDNARLDSMGSRRSASDGRDGRRGGLVLG